MRRREFLQGLCLATASVCIPFESLAAGNRQRFQSEASFYEILEGNVVRCLVCPRECVVGPGSRGFCRVRQNIDGKYYTLVYGRVCSYHIDPIEKKPLFHFLPGTTAFSIATAGCNLTCKFCQNWEISQQQPENVNAVDLRPVKIADFAARYGCPTIAYTYNEPTVFYEFMMDCASEGKKRNIRSVMISAGYVNKQPLLQLTAGMDAIKVDLKSFSDDFYSRICSASLKPVLDTIVTVRERGTWLEIVNLIIPTLNDDPKDIEKMCLWILRNVGDDVPVHFTRFYPTYKLKNLPPTPVASVERARDVALSKGLKFAYVGNVPVGHPGESTYCPSCGKRIIHRWGYSVRSIRIKAGHCEFCGENIPGVWS